MRTLLDDRRLLLPVLLTALVIAVGSVLIIVLTKDASGGGAASADTAAQSAGSAPGGAVKVDITNFKYVPATVTVKTGSRVTWVNNDAAPHTATAADAFDTGSLDKGDSKPVTLSKPGSYSYVCEFHAFMKGTVVVK